ncbi:biopolymer transporter [Limnohabitans sp. MORI2]|uniref:ExbD/TolR family protein n=1 Tax=Limnohabitans sp. MORI2 TaxID=1751150 RepID=UPI00237709EB|nr:biopolymer transporter ExbD [Limnohabitans sp. MORI2]BDU59460.1 biopolymer transporter [Limnohabitans sp. MORI2]
MSFEANDNADEVMSEINMTPLVDVMLVLLVIFIITLPVIQHAVKVDLPRASSTRNAPLPDNLQLSIDAQGQFFFGKQAIDATGLQIRLQTEASKDPQPQLFIRGDKRVPYEFVAQAMSTAQRAGMQRIGFVTTQP